MAARILYISEPDGIAANKAGERAEENPQPARIYQFPSPRPVQVKIDLDRIEARNMRLVLGFEIGAALLACGTWLVWHLTHLSAAR